MIIGVTGSREGMTLKQKSIFSYILSHYICAIVQEAHHGLCIGADEDAHYLLRLQGQGVKIHGWPAKVDKGLCSKKCRDVDIRNKRMPPLDRNKKIVDFSDLLFVFPKEFEEIRRSGTWSTCRYARKKEKKITIIWPDGTIKFE